MFGGRNLIEFNFVFLADMTPVDNLDFLGTGRVADLNFYDEPVQLSFRKRERALIFDWVLGPDDDKWFRQDGGFSFKGDLTLLHGFEQSGLGFRRGAVDLIREDDIGKDGSSPKDEIAFRAVVNIPPSDVCGEQIWGKLDSLEVKTEGGCQAFCDQGFSQARKIFNQDMPAGEDGCQNDFQGFAFSDDRLFNFYKNIVAEGGYFFELASFNCQNATSKVLNRF